MSTRPAGIRRLCIAVDLERYSRRDDAGQVFAQAGIQHVLVQACDYAQLDRALWQTQHRGDGELALLPPGVDEPRVISDFVRELRVALSYFNRNLNERARLRLRLAITQGLTQLADSGFGGQAVVEVARLVDAEQLKAALREHPEVDLALIVSDELYRSVIKHDFHDLRAGSFRGVRVTAKDFAADAWIQVPTAAAAEKPGADGDLQGAALMVHDPQGQVSRFPLRGDRVMIGRPVPGDLPLPDVPIDDPDPLVSREHCWLERRHRRWHLVVLTRVNGEAPSTYLRHGHDRPDERITGSRMLYDGDVILLPAKWAGAEEPRWWELHYSDPHET